MPRLVGSLVVLGEKYVVLTKKAFWCSERRLNELSFPSWHTVRADSDATGVPPS
jgi:hypothetical protein